MSSRYLCIFADFALQGNARSDNSPQIHHFRSSSSLVRTLSSYRLPSSDSRLATLFDPICFRSLLTIQSMPRFGTVFDMQDHPSATVYSFSAIVPLHKFNLRVKPDIKEDLPTRFFAEHLIKHF